MRLTILMMLRPLWGGHRDFDVGFVHHRDIGSACFEMSGVSPRMRNVSVCVTMCCTFLSSLYLYDKGEDALVRALRLSEPRTTETET